MKTAPKRMVTASSPTTFRFSPWRAWWMASATVSDEVMSTTVLVAPMATWASLLASSNPTGKRNR